MTEISIFTDGEPLDTQKLNKLYNKVVTIEAQVAATSAAADNLKNSALQSYKVFSDSVRSLTPSTTSKPVDLKYSSAGFTGVPQVVATIRGDVPKGIIVQYYITDITTTSATLFYVSDKAWTGAPIGFDFIVSSSK